MGFNYSGTLNVLALKPTLRTIDDFLYIFKTANMYSGSDGGEVEIKNNRMELGDNKVFTKLMTMHIGNASFFDDWWLKHYLNLYRDDEPIPALAKYFKAGVEIIYGYDESDERRVYMPDGKCVLKESRQEGEKPFRKSLVEIVQDWYAAYELERVAKEGE